MLCYGVTRAIRFEEEETEEEGTERKERREGEDWFLLHDSKHVVKTDAGNVRVVRSSGWGMIERPMHIGFITMEPKTLFIPQYLDSSLIILIRRGTPISILFLFIAVLDFCQNCSKKACR